jgi:hypothetical protein
MFALLSARLDYLDIAYMCRVYSFLLVAAYSSYPEHGFTRVDEA